MTEDSDSISEEERSLFRPFTRESLVQIENRIAEHEKQKELERKRLEGEAPVNITMLKLVFVSIIQFFMLNSVYVNCNFCSRLNEYVMLAEIFLCLNNLIKIIMKR